MDNKTVIIPNGTLSNQSLTNVTARPERQLDLKIGISYEADLKKAKELIEKMLNEEAAVIQEEMCIRDRNVHYSVKRIVGLPGETVEIKEGRIYIDGEEMKEDIYVSDIDYAGVAGEPLKLGEDEYFVMGDNQAGSDDSRMADIGNVKRNEIYGKVWFVISLGSHFGPV